MLHSCKLLSYGSAAQALSAPALDVLRAQVPAFPWAGEMQTFPKRREAFAALADCFQSERIILFFVAAPQYLSAKELLLRLMELPGEPHTDILNTLHRVPMLPPEIANAHALAPVDAQVFQTDNGLYSGFAITSNEQVFCYLPLEPSDLRELLKNGLAQYLQRLCPADTPRPVAQATQGESEDAPPAQATLEPVRDSHGGPEESEPFVSPEELVSALFCAGMDLALAHTVNGEQLAHRLQPVSGYEQVLKLASKPFERGDSSRKEHCAALASAAREEQNTVLGAALTDIYSVEGETTRFIYLGIANETHVQVLKLYANEGEDAAALLQAAMQKLFMLLRNYAAENGFTLPQEQELQPLHSSSPRKRFTPLYLLLAGIAILLCLLVVWLANGSSANADSEPPPDKPVNAAAEQEQEAAETVPNQSVLDELLAQHLRERAALQTTPPAQTQAANGSLPVFADGFAGETTAELLTTDTTVPHSGSENTTATTAETQTATTAQRLSATSKTTKLPVKPTEKATTAARAQAKSGVFLFTCYGYGHGVGMSQQGAIVMANSGSSAEEILEHYYGLPVKQDTNTPKTVSFAGRSYALADYLAKTSQAEIGSYSVPEEAIQAQVIAAYSFAKYYGFQNLSSKHAFSYDQPSEKTYAAVYRVLGMKDAHDKPTGVYLSYQGKAALAIYCDSVAGKTANAAGVWGGDMAEYPYLKGGAESPEQLSPRTTRLTSEELRNRIAHYNNSSACREKITLQKDPADWITIRRHDASISKNCGYVEELTVGNVSMSGNFFRYYVLDLGIRSHCFQVGYGA